MMKNQTPDAQSVLPQAAGQAASTAKLDQLEDYLRHDSDNLPLLIDAFESALRCAAWSRAAIHLQRGQTLMPDDLGWSLREGDFWLAQSQYEQARKTLEQLLAHPKLPSELSDVVVHNLAYIDFQNADYAVCVSRLSPRLEALQSAGGAVNPVDPVLQVLWLRALHRVGDLRRAIVWAEALTEAGHMPPQVAGVASLIALDAGEIKLSQQWSAVAIENGSEQDKPIEALVAQASLALAARDAARAQALATAALQLNPRDGRAFSARAFASLMAGQLDLALKDFAKALAHMPGHIGTWQGQAWTQLLLSDLVGAQTSFKQALALDQNFSESHGGLAVALALSNDPQLARVHMEFALRLDRTNVSGRFAQAILSGEVKEAEAFKRLAERLLGNQSAPLGGTVLDAVLQSAGSSSRGSNPPL
jgi:tetratricopeptide (TPR) repeat protein